MITQFKIFENINVGEPKEGDYVILDPTNFTHHQDKVKKYIGKINIITDVEDMSGEITKEYKVLYEENTKFGVSVFGLIAYRHEIIIFSKNREDLFPYVAANKFNL